MRHWSKQAVLLTCLCAALSGCATMRYPSAYKIEGKEFKDFKDLDDESALKIVALIYNVRYECREDSVARSIALEEYLKLLAKRNSQYIKSSGIFDAKYDKVRLSSWKDGDLVKLYDFLSTNAEIFYSECSSGLTEAQNAQRIVYLTAINYVAKELKKRDITQRVTEIAGQVLFTAISVALSMI